MSKEKYDTKKSSCVIDPQVRGCIKCETQPLIILYGRILLFQQKIVFS